MRLFRLLIAGVLLIAPLTAPTQAKWAYLHVVNHSEYYAWITISGGGSERQRAFRLTPGERTDTGNSNCLVFSCSVRFQFMLDHKTLCDTTARGWHRGTATGRFDHMTQRCWIE